MEEIVLTQDEQEIIDRFRKIPPEVQVALVKLVETFGNKEQMKDALENLERVTGDKSLVQMVREQMPKELTT